MWFFLFKHNVQSKEIKYNISQYSTSCVKTDSSDLTESAYVRNINSHSNGSIKNIVTEKQWQKRNTHTQSTFVSLFDVFICLLRNSSLLISSRASSLSSNLLHTHVRVNHRTIVVTGRTCNGSSTAKRFLLQSSKFHLCLLTIMWYFCRFFSSLVHVNFFLSRLAFNCRNTNARTCALTHQPHICKHSHNYNRQLSHTLSLSFFFNTEKVNRNENIAHQKYDGRAYCTDCDHVVHWVRWYWWQWL